MNLVFNLPFQKIDTPLVQNLSLFVSLYYSDNAYSKTMSNSTQNREMNQIKKAIGRLGLKLSESELIELELGKTISLAGRRLSEIGSIFILAEALSGLHSVENMTFQDLLEVVAEPSSYSGIPIYHWDSEILGQRCFLLTMLDGKPAVTISSR